MKKILTSLALALACGAAMADDLADAKKLFDTQDFKGAQAIYSRLAEGGNTEAQVLLAEMWWYGEAGGIDLAKAEKWFKAAAAKGDVKAQAALKAMAARVARLPEIEKYTKNFSVAELSYDKANCAKPDFPANSRTKKQIREVDADYKKWADCHTAYVTRLNAALPVEKSIPKDLSDLMTDDDMKAAQAKMIPAYQALIAQANAVADEVVAKQKAWQASTAQYVEAAENARIAGLRQREAEMNNAAAGGDYRSSAPSNGYLPSKAK